MLDNEAAVVNQLEALAADEATVRDYRHILAILERHTSPNPAEMIAATEELRDIAAPDLRKMIDGLINIACLRARLAVQPAAFKFLCITLASYLAQVCLNSDSPDDTGLMVRWLNKLSYGVFRTDENPENQKHLAVAFARLLSHSEFFSDAQFSDEVYYRFVKKFFSNNENESQLRLSIMFCEVLLQEDSLLVVSALPRIVPDAVEAFSSCGNMLLDSLQQADFASTFACIETINTVCQKLLSTLEEDFPKYSRQGLEVMSSSAFCFYLTKVPPTHQIQNLFQSKEVADLPVEAAIRLRTPLLSCLNSLFSIARRFEKNIQEEAPEYQTAINSLIQQFSLRDSFQVMAFWANKVFEDMLLLAAQVTRGSPDYALRFLQLSLECVGRALELPVLSLEIQKSSEE